MSISDIIAVLALILSIINFYLLQRQYKQTTMPAIKHIMRELPPYSTKHDLTMISITNVGNAIAEIRSTHIETSWDDSNTVELSYPYDEVFLAPHEESTFHE